MCQSYLNSNEGMEPADNMRFVNNNGDHVGSSTSHVENAEQGQSVKQDAPIPGEAPFPSPITPLISCDSFASNFSDYSVDVNPHNVPVPEEGGVESGQDDPRCKMHKSNSSSVALEKALLQSDNLRENHNKGKNGFVHRELDFVSQEANDDSKGSNETSDEEDEQSTTYDDQDDMWYPPEAENEDDNVENSVAALDEDDDECANVDGSEWAMPSSLNSFEEGVRSSYYLKEVKQQEMEKVMNGKFKNLVSQLLRKVGVDNCDNKEQSWVDTVTLLAWQAASFVKPEAAEGKTMDPAGYVKIKCIETGSPVESRLIKGLVFKKHAAHKHMATNYKNPSLLLIQGMLEPSSGSSGLSSFNTMMSEKKDNSAVLMENLQACHPNVILVEKSASRDVLQKVLDLGVTLVLDMKLHRLERLARCTGSPILSLSPDEPFSQKLKHCDSLYFEKIVEEHAIVGDGVKKPCKTLMFVEGCPTRLGCTILLKGSQREELKKIKCVVQCAVVMAYHFLLETSFLVDQKAMFDTIAFGKETDLSLTVEQCSSASSRRSNVFNIMDSDVDGASVKIPISNGDNEGSNPVQEYPAKIAASSLLDHQRPNGSHHEVSSESSYVKDIAANADEAATSNGFHDKASHSMQCLMDNPSILCQEPHMTTLSTASSSIHDVLKRVSVVSPDTYEDMSTYIDMYEKDPEAQTAVSIPISPSEQAPEQNDSSKDSISPHNDSQFSNFSASSGEVTGVGDDCEDCIRPKDEISNVLDSESILVLMSTRNASKGTICEQSRFSHIKFYRNFDVPLGKFLQNSLFNQTEPCKSCNELPEAHFYYYAHHSKQLTIRVKRLGDKMHLPGESEGKLWMWSRCAKCAPDKEKVTKRVLISTAARGLSFGKFLELSFSSHSSFDTLSSCRHSFQKDFLYFFGLGSMVAMFRYSRVATYTVSMPAEKLEFNSSLNRDLLQREIETVYTKGLLLFAEVGNYLKKIESRFSGQNLVLNGLSLGFGDIVHMLKLERSDFEENIKNTSMKNEDSHDTVHILLSLNRLRWEILLEACVWDRRLQLLLSSSSGLHKSTITDDVVQRQMDLKEDRTPGGLQTGVEQVFQGQTVLEDHRSLEVEGTQELDSEAGEEQVDTKDHSEGTVTRAANVVEGQTGSEDHCVREIQGERRAADNGHPNVTFEIIPDGDYNSSKNCTDIEVHIESVEGAELSARECLNEAALQECEEQGLLSLPINKENLRSPKSEDLVPRVSLLQDLDGSTNLSSHLHSSDSSTHINTIMLSSNISGDRSIPIEGDEEDKSHSAGTEVSERVASSLSNFDSRGWVWNPFTQIREGCIMDLHKGLLPKFGHLPKFALLHSTDFLPTVSEVITEEGSRMHIPLRDGQYIVSDFDGEISSSVACALALMMDLTPPTSDSNDNATLKRAVSEPSTSWYLGSSFDPDVIQSATSMSFSDSRFSNFSGFSHLDSLISHGQVHPEVTLGIEKNSMKGKYSVVIMYANEFRRFRERCCPSELDYIASLSRCKIWDAKGGKSKSVFAKTHDNRLIIKEIKKTEFESFMKFATEYFKHMEESVVGNQTCLAKILGIYQITIRHPKSGKETKHDLMVMENLSYGRNISRQYDLKGALHARFTATGDGVEDVLLDQNFVNDMNTSPLYVGQRAKRLLERAIWNDTRFLESINVMDYSLLVGVDRKRRELLCGVIDYIRQYTLDKQLETWVKSSLVVPKNVSPTIISPEQYKKRFRKFMSTYFLSVPDHWCSQRSSNPCKLCGIRSEDSSLPKSEKLEELAHH